MFRTPQLSKTLTKRRNCKQWPPKPDRTLEPDWTLPPAPVPCKEHLIHLSVETVVMRFSWSEYVDLDAAAVLLNAKGHEEEKICHRKERSSHEAVLHSGDRGTRKEDDFTESITVKLGRIPLRVHYIFLAVCARSNEVSLGHVNGARVQMMLSKEGEKGDMLYDLPLKDVSEGLILVGMLARHGVQWKFKPLGMPFANHDFAAVLYEESDGIIRDLRTSFPATAAVERNVSVKVLEARNLAPKESPWWNKEKTSNPFPLVMFGGKEAKVAKSRTKTLEPAWDSKPFSMGCITEAESNPLKVILLSRRVFSSHKFMGMIEVPGYQIFELGVGEHAYWFPLQDSKKPEYKHETVSGEVLVEFNVNVR